MGAETEPADALVHADSDNPLRGERVAWRLRDVLA
jgi:hypothetical protein